MKIVNRADFIKYPAGTLYYPYTATLMFGELLIKGETGATGGFTAVSMNHPVNPVGDNLAVFKEAVVKGDSFAISFDESTVDDEPNEALLYAVYELADVEKLGGRLGAAFFQYEQAEAIRVAVSKGGEHIGNGMIVPKHLSKERFPGHHYVPANATGLVELSLQERCDLYSLWFGGYGVTGFDGITEANRVDLQCLMNNNRIPTHRDVDAPTYRGIVFESTVAGATTAEQLIKAMGSTLLVASTLADCRSTTEHPTKPMSEEDAAKWTVGND